MSPETLQKANRAIQSGDKATARRLLAEILYADPRNSRAWLLMSSAVENVTQRRECLQRVLQIDPQNQEARAGITWLDSDARRPMTAPEPLLSAEQTGPLALPVPGSPLPPARTTLPGTPLNTPSAAAEGVSRASDTYARRRRAQTELSTRQELVPGSPSVQRLSADERQRRSGYRNIMLAGAMTLSLMCGLVLLITTLTSVVPQAQARIKPTPVPILYTAALWCPPCEQAGSKIILWEKVGDGISRGAKVGELGHDTAVSVLAETWSNAEGRMYFQVQAQGQAGWVPDTFVQK